MKLIYVYNIKLLIIIILTYKILIAEIIVYSNMHDIDPNETKSIVYKISKLLCLWKN